MPTHRRPVAAVTAPRAGHPLAVLPLAASSAPTSHAGIVGAPRPRAAIVRAGRPLAAALLAIAVLAGCDRAPSADAAGADGASRSAANPRTAAADDRAAAPVKVLPWALPVVEAGAQPDLVLTPDGRLLMSWIQTTGAADGREHTFALASFDPRQAPADAAADGAVAPAAPKPAAATSGSARPAAATAAVPSPAAAPAAAALPAGWSAPRRIAQGRDWFVNWADTPHVAMTADGALWAHWLRKSAAASYSYDVVLVRSGDDGASWSAPLAVNQDGLPAEHGFVSMWPSGPDSLGIAWLDGRRTADAPATAGTGRAHQHAAAATPAALPADALPKAMTLRSTRFDATLARHDETELDLSTCDCCQTDAVATADGALVAYRDRAPGEIRDIRVARLVQGRWQSSVPVHADGWVMPACPVNGPAIAARGDAALVAWYTATGGTPAVRIARSGDAGASFAAPVTVESGPQVQGRVALALGDDAAWLLWTREDAQGQSLWLARYTPDLGRELQRVQVAALQGRGRGTGFAQLRVVGSTGYALWTDVVDGRPRLHGARLAAQ